jgi:hypothetical protein
VAEFPLHNAFFNFSLLDWVDVHIANDPDTAAARFDLVVRDRRGKNATLHSNLTTILGWPVNDKGYVNPTRRIHARTLRGSLASVRNLVDVSGIDAVYLVSRCASGRVWVLDVAASQAQVRQPKRLHLPVISIDTTQVPEGDGLQTYRMNITTNKPLKLPGSIWVTVSYGIGVQVDLFPGSGTVVASVPVFSNVSANNVYDSDVRFSETLRIEALQNVVIGNFKASFTVIEDDPIPIVVVVSKNVTAAEGGSLRWLVELSSATQWTELHFSVLPPPNGETELTSDDVDPNWLRLLGYYIPTTPVPLSERLHLGIPVRFPLNVTRRNLLIPLINDGQPEGNKVIVLQLKREQYTVPVLYTNITLYGNVPAHG